MGIFDNILGNDDDKKKDKDEGRLTLHKEELDINKRSKLRQAFANTPVGCAKIEF